MFGFIRFMDFILSLISSPKRTLLILIICGFLMTLFLALWSGDEKLLNILCRISALAILGGLMFFIRNSKNNAERWLKVIRIIALSILVILCYKVESQRVLYVYLGTLGILFIYTLWIVASGKMKETKDKLKDTNLKEEIENSSDNMKKSDKQL